MPEIGDHPGDPYGLACCLIVKGGEKIFCNILKRKMREIRTLWRDQENVRCGDTKFLENSF